VVAVVQVKVQEAAQAAVEMAKKVVMVLLEPQTLVVAVEELVMVQELLVLVALAVQVFVELFTGHKEKING
jgi:hypothetical protein